MSSYGDILDAVTTPPIASVTPPVAPQAGALWFDTNAKQLYIWNGFAWVGAGGVASLPPAAAADQVLMSNGAGTVYSARSAINLGNY